MVRSKFIAGNWKMYTSLASAKDLAHAVAAGVTASNHLKVAVCPPYPWLNAVSGVLSGTAVQLGAQNCHWENEGAYTGEVAPAMLVEAGCQYVIIGHSERRHGFQEQDNMLNAKTKAALKAGLQVIFCVGELLTERQADETEAVLKRQLGGGLADLTESDFEKIVIAYEPVWAIGTGQVATPEQAQAAHAFIRGQIRQSLGEKVADAVLIQYGGSVKPENAKTLLHLPDVDGALVGGASLKPESFLAIVQAAQA